MSESRKIEGLAKEHFASSAAGAAIHAATVLFQITLEGRGDRDEQKRLLAMDVHQHQDAIAQMAIRILERVGARLPEPLAAPALAVRGVPELDILEADHIDMLDKPKG